MNEDNMADTIFCTPLTINNGFYCWRQTGETIPTINARVIITEPSSKYKWFKKKKKNRRRKT